MSEWTINTLKEHLESEILNVSLLLEEKLKCSSNALELQAQEYERRLETLNHAHEQAVEVQNTYISQDKFHDYTQHSEGALVVALQHSDEKFFDRVKPLEDKQVEVDRLLAMNAGKGIGLNVGWSYLVAVISVTAVLISIVISISTFALVIYNTFK